MRQIKRVSFVTNNEGKILQCTYEGDKSELEEKGLRQNVLDFAIYRTHKGDKVILIEQGEKPCISALALQDVIEIEKIKHRKIYTSSPGYDVSWEKEGKNFHTVGIEINYDWILTVKCGM